MWCLKNKTYQSHFSRLKICLLEYSIKCKTNHPSTLGITPQAYMDYRPALGITPQPWRSATLPSFIRSIYIFPIGWPKNESTDKIVQFTQFWYILLYSNTQIFFLDCPVSSSLQFLEMSSIRISCSLTFHNSLTLKSLRDACRNRIKETGFGMYSY